MPVTKPNLTTPRELPLIAHATLAEAFLRDNPGFVSARDPDGLRWDKWLLWRAVSDYLKSLFNLYEAPTRGRDPRTKLHNSSFIAGVVRVVKVLQVDEDVP